MSGKNFIARVAGALVMALIAGPALSQGTAATVSGFVGDSTGAAIPHAKVTFKNLSTGASSTGNTTGEGLYRISGLLPGVYEESISADGFKTEVKRNIQLHVEDDVALNVSLEIGAASETVTVNAEVGNLEAATPTISQVIEGRQVEDTPLNGRNTMNLVALTPGVISQGGTSGGASNNTNGGSFTNANGFGNYSIAGGLANQQSTYVDGAPINITQGHPITYVITQDAVQEFRVESSVVRPQYGEFAGGVISFATRSGTNQFHGTAYEYLRNTDLDANNFFNKNAGVRRPKFMQNQFGADIGGPIRKEKAFFFISYEGFRQAQGVPFSGHVPTTAELNGDFTADPVIYNPTPTAAPGGAALIYRQATCQGVPNKICLNPAAAAPGDAIADPTAVFLAQNLRYFPAPNIPGASGTAINFQANGNAAAWANQYTGRLDYSLTAKQKLFARYTRLDRYQEPTQFLNNPVGPNSGVSVGAVAQNYVVGDTVTLNATSALDIRGSYLRYFSFLLPQNTNVNLAALSPAWAAIAPQLTYQEFPYINIPNNIPYPYSTLDNTQFSHFDNYTLSASYSKLLGRHSVTVGGEARRREEYFNQAIAAPGLFVFAGTATSCIPAAPTIVNGSVAIPAHVCSGPTTPAGLVIPGSGATPVADFLTGTITTAPLGLTEVSFPSALNHYYGLYANDSIQFGPKITLVAGLRYELPGGFTEKHDKNAVLLPGQANPLTLVNTSAYRSRSDLDGHYNLFSPRVGLLFSPVSRTTFRAGYSLVFLPQDTVYNAGPAGSSVNQPTTFIIPGMKLSNPLLGSPAGPTTVLQPIGRGYANNPAYFFGQSIEGRDPHSSFPYLEQWNANVQQQFAGATVLQLAYLGARGEHIPIYGTIDINQLPDQYDGLSAAQIGLMGSNNTNPNGNGAGLRPYSLYQNVNQLSAYVGDTYYHSLQATVSKRFKSGGTLLANYSWSKFLGNSESTNAAIETHTAGVIQDYTNLRAERSYLSFDVPQRLVVSYILDLPIGRGKHLLSNAGDVLNTVISGWNVGGINSVQSGFPLAIIATNNSLANKFGAGQIRPNYLTGCPKALGGSIVDEARTGSPVLNHACFSAPADVAFGDQPRTDGSIRTQGVDNWDFSVGKPTPIGDKLVLVFRAEAFNVTNRVQFGDPNLNSSTQQFGVLTTQANSPRSLQFSLRLNY